MDRKLAAILAADVVGYSSHMERDEAGTFARLKAGREQLFEPEIVRHHGRIFKVMGDGMLAEFGSVVDAVECAVALQRGLAERNAHVPEPERTQVRIGINLGEVIVEGDDRYGEGVNIATRLEQLAEPGGICVSGKVAKEVEKKLAFGFESLGDRKVKNIAEPVSVYRVNLEGEPVRRPGPAALRSSWKWAALAAAVGLAASVAWIAPWSLEPRLSPTAAEAEGKPSLVVLPFANLSDDPEQGYLADGITEDLTTELARVPGLFVISRNAAFTYKGKAMPPAQIAEELGVRYLLEGSTRRAGEEMRINAQLIDAETGGHLWAERFDGQWTDVFALQNKVVESVAAALKLRLVAGIAADFAGGTSNPEAYDLYLRGVELYLRGEPKDAAQVVQYYEQALALDPDFSAAAAELTWVYWDAVDESAKALGLSWEEIDAKRREALARAAENPSPSYYQMSAQLLTRENRSDEAIDGLQKAIALDPSNPWTFEGMSQAMIFNGRPTEGRAYLDTAMRLDPGWGDFRRYLAGVAAFGEENYDEAIAELEEIDLQGPNPWPRWYGLQVLMSAYGHLGRAPEIEATKAKFQAALTERGEPPYDMLRTQHFFVYKNEADIQRLLDGLAKAGIPELPADVDSQSKDRLTGDQIRSLTLGRELRGRQIVPKLAEYMAASTVDGSLTATIGAKTREGTTWVQGNVRCTAFAGDLTQCGAVFRKPSGTREENNEYLLVHRTSQYEFSVVE